jgi:hypothetical protein
MAVGSVDLAFGSVQYFKKIESVAATTEVKGNLTINNTGSPGIPEHLSSRSC